MNSGVKYKVTPAPLGLNCIYYDSKACSSHRLPAEAIPRRKTAFKVHKEAYLGPLEQYQGPTAIGLELI